MGYPGNKNLPLYPFPPLSKKTQVTKIYVISIHTGIKRHLKTFTVFNFLSIFSIIFSLTGYLYTTIEEMYREQV